MSEQQMPESLEPPVEAGESVIEGALEVVHPHTIAGWAWNSSMPRSPVRVDLFVDGKLAIVGILANQFRDDLLQAGKGNGKHGFEVIPPPVALDGEPHDISLKIWGPLLELVGSPQILQSTPTPADQTAVVEEIATEPSASEPVASR
jgi:hypothetical protein